MISVVVPLYNKRPHIARALDSVLSQTALPREVIVVDDGSTDGSADIVRKYASRGVRLLQQPNQGVSAARNNGLKLATSEYVAFLDADDWWLPNHLCVVEDMIASYPTASLLSTAYQVFRRRKMHRPHSVFREGWRGIVPDFFYAFANGLALVNSSTAVVRCRDFLSIGGFPIGVRRGEDIIVWLKLAMRHPVAHAEVATSIYDHEAVNRVNTLKEEESPGSLRYIASMLEDAELVPQWRDSLTLLFDRMALFTAAGFCLIDNRRGARAIGSLSVRCGRLRVATAITVLASTPLVLLQGMQRLRHSKMTTLGPP